MEENQDMRDWSVRYPELIQQALARGDMAEYTRLLQSFGEYNDRAASWGDRPGVIASRAAQANSSQNANRPYYTGNGLTRTFARLLGEDDGSGDFGGDTGNGSYDGSGDNPPYVPPPDNSGDPTGDGSGDNPPPDDNSGDPLAPPPDNPGDPTGAPPTDNTPPGDVPPPPDNNPPPPPYVPPVNNPPPTNTPPPNNNPTPPPTSPPPASNPTPPKAGPIFTPPKTNPDGTPATYSGQALNDTSGRTGGSAANFGAGMDVGNLTPADFDYYFNWINNPAGAARNTVKQFGFNYDNNPYTQFLQDRAGDIGATTMANAMIGGGKDATLNANDVTFGVGNALAAGGSRGAPGTIGGLAGLEALNKAGGSGLSLDQAAYLKELSDNPQKMSDILGAQGSSMLQQATKRLFANLYQDYLNASPSGTPGFMSFLHNTRGWN